MAPQYFGNGYQYIPGVSFDIAQSFGIGISSSTSATMVIVANPASSTPAEVFQLSTSGGVTMPSTGGFKLGSTGPAAPQSITGIYAVTLSTYAPTAMASSTGRIDLVPSASFTWTTNDLTLAVLPSSYNTTGSVLGGCFPTSSGGIGFAWLAGIAGSTPSTGAYKVITFRTT